ncbi:MAG: hypothetical protein E7355_02165 [Clostridiales bacterium]|nr:hypothetical protein [Clostridiales bacterium]
MNMLTVLAILTVLYFFSLVLLCEYRYQINIKLFNGIFICADLLFYLCWNVGMWQKGWLDNGFHTLENISPLCFTLIPLTCLMNDKTKEYSYAVLAFLNFGMLVALYVSPQYEYLVNYEYDATFVYTGEMVCHMLCSLFGIYLVLTGQVKADFERWVKSILFLLAIVSFGVFLNYVFHKSYFGMDPYGQYSIYMIDIFDTFGATLAAYYLGIILVLTVGMQVCVGLERLSSREERAKFARLFKK